MVVSKAEIDKLNKSEQKILKSLEIEIDDCLRNNNKTYSISGISKKIIDEICNIYEKVGWIVEVIYDQRDGDYLRFK